MNLTIAFTGHRPPRLGIGYTGNELQDFCKVTLQKFVQLSNTFINYTIISGMAQGFDQAIAEAAIELKLPLICALPFKGQESKWPLSAQYRYNSILANAIEIKTVCEGGYAAYKFIERDKWMVDNCGLLVALLDDKPEKSGTRHTYEYALEKKKEIWLWWDMWEAFKGSVR